MKDKEIKPLTRILLPKEEYEVLQKVLRANPPAKTNLNGVELYFYRSVLTIILKEDFTFPDTDDGIKEEERQ